MTRKFLMVVIALFLLVFALPAQAQDAAPLNHCTTIGAEQETGLTTYEVNATGTGRYFRLVEYPVVGAPVIVAGPRDFGAGATAYQFQHVALDPSRAYQGQTSHTSLTTGYSTTGCILTPPPLVISLDSFDARCLTFIGTPDVELSWITTSELLPFFELRREGEVIATIPAVNPQGWKYTYIDKSPLPAVKYEIVYGDENLFDTVDCSAADPVPPVPTAVTLSGFTAGSSCKLTGKQSKQACVCRLGNRWVGAPMWRCK